MICPVLIKYPDEFIPNTKFVWNGSTIPNTPPLHLSDVHDTSGMIPPLRTPCPVITRSRYFIHRWNSRSQPRALYCVRTPPTLRLPCLVFVLLLLLCIYCFSPSLFSGRPPNTTAVDVAVFDYFVDDRTPTIELPGKQSHFPSPTYRLLFYVYLLH